MASNDGERLPDKLECTNLAKEWPQWKQQFLLYMFAKGKMEDSELKKVSSLLYCMGKGGLEIFNSMHPNKGDITELFVQPERVIVAAEQVDENDANAVAAAENARIAAQAAIDAALPRPLTLAIVLKSFDEYCVPKKNLAMESFKFHTIVQKEKQSFGEFETELRTQVQYCGFECSSCKKPYAERMLRDRIIVAVQDKKLQLKLLDGKDEPLSNVIDKCKVYEAAAANKRILEKKSEKVDAKVDAVDIAPSSTDVVRKYNCYNCGRAFGPNHLENCPAKDVECRSCGKKGHFANYCRKAKSKPKTGATGTNAGGSQAAAGAKSVKQIKWCDFGNDYSVNLSVMDGNESIDPVCSLNTCSINATERCHGAINQIGSWYKTLRIGDRQIKFKLDTGADVSCIPVGFVNRLSRRYRNEIEKSENVLTDYSSNKLKLHGTIKLDCFDTERLTACTVLFHIVDDEFEPLLGLPECISMGLVKQLSTVQSLPVSKSEFVERNRKIFDGLGRIPGKCSIKLREDSEPVMRYKKRIPSSLIEPLKKEIDQMVASGILSPVDYPTDWVNNLQIVEKPNGKLRICLDPKPLNKCIRREHFLIPTSEDLISRLSGQNVFTVLDCSNGFWQMELDDESADLTTFMTPFGRFRWNRVPFGLNNAPELFQKRMVKTFGDIHGVEVYFDDILVGGPDEAAHDEALSKVIERARESNVRFNEGKLQYRSDTVKFMGNIISSGGIKPDSKYIRAIADMPRPSNKADVMRLLGLFKYLARFIPNLSQRSARLRELTKNNVEWIWTNEHTAEVNDLLSSISSAPVLAIFDPSKPIVVQTDSSKDGLGSVLLQDGQPVAYASRSLTATEQRYAQIEKELLAIVFACERFHHFLYGREFVVHSDHKPLESLVKREIDDVTMRLQRMFMQLLKYPGMSIKYIPGKEMLVADCLSRASLTEMDPEHKELSDMIHVITRRVCLSEDNYEMYLSAIKEDEKLNRIIKYVVNGWPSYHQLDDISQKFHKIKDELHYENQLLLRNDRLVVPVSMQSTICKWLHVAHLGIEKTLARAREQFYWPGMATELTEVVRNCSICEQFKRNNQKEPLVQDASPDYPWHKVSMDVYEFAGHDYLAVIDAYSGLLCSERLRSKSSGHIIELLHRIFSFYGYPTEVRADNSPFGSREFERFANDANIVFKFSSPRYPQSNGLAEKGVAIAKNILRRCHEDGAMDQLAYRILEYNATPVASMGMSPASLFFGRRIKTKLPIVDELLHRSAADESTIQQKFERKKERQKKYYDRSSKSLPMLDVGTRVIFKKNGKEWHYGRIVRSVDDRSYIVVDDYENHYRRNRRFIAKAYGNGINTSEMLGEEMDLRNRLQEAAGRIVPPAAVHQSYPQQPTEPGNVTLPRSSVDTHRRPSVTSEPETGSENAGEVSQSSTYFDAESDSQSSDEEPPDQEVNPEPMELPTNAPYRTRSGREVRPPDFYGDWVRH